MSQRKNHFLAFNVKADLAALSGGKRLRSRVQSRCPPDADSWALKQLKESATDIFAGEIKMENGKKEKLQVLPAKIGQLTVERDFLVEVWGKLCRA